MKREIDIPKGFEIESYTYNCNILDIPINHVLIKLKPTEEKKEPVKDFDWYIKEYTMSHDLIHVLGHIDSTEIRARFYARAYILIPFALRVGLLKFICDDVKYDWFAVMTSLKYSNSDAKKIFSVCPKEFTDSLFSNE